MSRKCQIFRNDFIISYITVRYISDKNQHSFSRCGFESHERIKINNWDLVVVVRHNPFLSARILPSPLILPRMFWLQSENTNLRRSTMIPPPMVGECSLLQLTRHEKFRKTILVSFISKLAFWRKTADRQ